MGTAGTPSRVFKYRWSVTSQLDVAAPLAICFFVWMSATSIKYSYGVAAFAALSALFFLCGFLVVHFTYSAIELDNDGLSTYAFGYRWKYVTWRDVTSIRKVREWDAPTTRYLTKFYVNTSSSSINMHMRHIFGNTPFRRGPIAFDERIIDLRMMLDAINSYAQRFQIEIVSVDREADFQRVRETGQSLWKELKERESKVATL
jgi:hypothetical protein